MEQRAEPLDMVTLNIVSGILVSICRDMGVTLMRTSYSTIFSESLDFTCGLALPTGELIATGDFCPSMIGGMPLLLRSCVQEIPLDTLREGDVLVHNDPYRGGLHTPEHTFFKPVFVDGEIIGFSVSIGHVCEVGGMAPAGFAGEATEVFHEGLRVPPVKLVRQGEDVPDIWRLLLANVRTPRYNYGDFRALIAATDLGERRLAALVRKHGKAKFLENVQELMNYSERRMRAEIAKIPDGKYTFEDYMEDDGIEDQSLPHQAPTVFVQGDELIVDYTGSDQARPRGRSTPRLGVAWGASYNAVLQLTDSEYSKEFRLLSPHPGAGTGWHHRQCQLPRPLGRRQYRDPLPHRQCVVMGALAPAMKDRSAATDGASHSNFLVRRQ